MKTGKVWGESRLLLRTPFVEVHAITIEKGGYCSWHKHRTKWNAFHVYHGTLHIEIERDHGLTDVTKLGPGELTTVKPGEWHRFKNVWGQCTALEIYHSPSGVPIDPDDIERRDNGGVL